MNALKLLFLSLDEILLLPLKYSKFSLVVPTSARLLLILWNNFSGVFSFSFL